MTANNSPKYWYDRGYLPHYDPGAITQFVTFRLADSLPKSVIVRYQLQLERKLISEIEYHRLIDKYLDNGAGAAHLKNVQVSECIEETLYKVHTVKYVLHSWVIMPNHVHLLFRPNENHSLAAIMHSIKSYTANFANKVLGLKS